MSRAPRTVLACLATALTATLVATGPGAVAGDASHRLVNRATFELDYDVSPGDGALVVENGALGSRYRALGGVLGFAIGAKGFAPIETRYDARREAVAGPERMSPRLRATATYRAIPRTGALRVLVALRNTSPRRVDEVVEFGGQLAARNDVTVEETSSGDRNFGRNDRWVITWEAHEPEAGARDRTAAAVTQVFAGRGGRSQVEDGFVSPVGLADVQAELPVQVPAKQTRFLLAYVSLAPYASVAGRDVRSFDRRRPGGRLLQGMGPSVRARVLNWDL